MISGLAVAGLMTSCQAPAHANMHTPNSAISCTKCGTVYFKSPTVTSAPGDKGFITLKSSSHMTCPDCDNKVVGWVKTGTFTQHVCKSCGGAMKHCTNH